MNTDFQKLFLSIILVLAGTNANAQNDNANNKFANELRDSANWKEYKSMPAVPRPKRRLYDPYAAWRAINLRHAQEMRDTTNWNTYRVQPPLKPEVIYQTIIKQNAKVR